MGSPANFERSVVCAESMIKLLEDNATEYAARYGQSMQIRIALHCGPVAAGEIGAWKKEIALLGDMMNSAARIEGAARSLSADVVMSDAIKTRLSQSWQSRLQKCTDYLADGKHDALKLWKRAKVDH